MPPSHNYALTLEFKGVRGSIPSPGIHTAHYGGNTSCVVVRLADDILILDAGTGIRAVGNDLSAEFGAQSISANVLISHTHWDHIQGLPFFAPAYAPQNRIRIFGANGSAPTLRRALGNQMECIHFPVALDDMHGLSVIAELNADCTRLGAFDVATIALNHPGGCDGFRVAAQGITIAYLPDHEPHHSCTLSGGNADDEKRRNSLVQFLRGANVLILDTQYTALEYRQRVGWGHGCPPDSVSLAIEAGVRQLFLFHHDPARDDNKIDELVNEARALADSSPLKIQAARENQTITFASPIAPLLPPPLLRQPNLVTSINPADSSVCA